MKNIPEIFMVYLFIIFGIPQAGLELWILLLQSPKLTIISGSGVFNVI